jgi:2-amino-4-hydroxy-6-hydroxymethyldihydropteridine diphosphokinase
LNDIEKKHKVFVGIGSNINQKIHIQACITAINEKFEHLVLSPTYESSSMGFDGPNFYNLVAAFYTNLDVNELKETLNAIERDNGRSLGEVKFSSRTLDIDILYYDNLVDNEKNIPRNEIVKFDFVLRPLYDVSPAHIHPITNKTHHTMINDTNYEKMIINEIDISYKL